MQFLTDYRHQRCASHATTPEFHSNSFNTITYGRIALSTCYTLGFVCLLVQLVAVHALVLANRAHTHKTGVYTPSTHVDSFVYPEARGEVDKLIRLWRSCEAVSARRKNRELRNENPELCTGAGQVRKWILARIRMNHTATVCQHNRLAKQSNNTWLACRPDVRLVFWKLCNWRKTIEYLSFVV